MDTQMKKKIDLDRDYLLINKIIDYYILVNRIIKFQIILFQLGNKLKKNLFIFIIYKLNF